MTPNNKSFTRYLLRLIEQPRFLAFPPWSYTWGPIPVYYKICGDRLEEIQGEEGKILYQLTLLRKHFPSEKLTIYILLRRLRKYGWSKEELI